MYGGGLAEIVLYSLVNRLCACLETMFRILKFVHEKNFIGSAEKKFYNCEMQQLSYSLKLFSIIVEMIQNLAI